ncbi:MAG TPA: FCD domain-containing protein [Pilimelia sp.]|nr:FCD domain-containing protein [Pilimelia sp.]
MGVTEDTIEKIKQMLVEGELGPGDKLPIERDLAARLGVSRNSLREAVRALTTIRVLQARQGDGTYVTSLAPELLLDSIGFVADLHRDAAVLEFLHVRRVLEPEATALAAARLADDELGRLDQLLGEAERLAAEPPVDHARMVANDHAFHSLITGACGNQVLAALITNLSSRTAQARIWRGRTDEDAMRRTLAEHRAIHAALSARDAFRARMYATTHVLGVEDWLRQVL